MMSKHTPGPWSVDLSDDRFIVRDANDDVVADCWNGTIGDDGETPLDTCEPNSRLIAAAPDMLEALKVARQIVAEFASDPRIPIHRAAELMGSIEKIDADIAKAEGRS